VIATTRAHGGVRGEQALPANVLRRIRQVEIKARILADEALLGTYRSVFRGSGLEFEEVREYEPGDDIRSIDWNVTARMGTPYIKKFREDRELSIFLAGCIPNSGEGTQPELPTVVEASRMDLRFPTGGREGHGASPRRRGDERTRGGDRSRDQELAPCRRQR